MIGLMRTISVFLLVASVAMLGIESYEMANYMLLMAIFIVLYAMNNDKSEE